MKKRLAGSYVLAIIAIILALYNYVAYKDGALSSMSLGNGSVTTEKLSPEVAKQVEAALLLAGALPISESGAFPSCVDGQVLSYSNGKFICAKVSGDSGAVAVTQVGPVGP